MLTARTYGRQRLGTVREGATCSFRNRDCMEQEDEVGGETRQQGLSAWLGL